MNLDIRPLVDDDLEAAHALRQQAFTVSPDAFDPDRPRGDAERDVVIGAFDGGRIVATASAYDFDQWFGGAAVPMGGVAGVAIAPEVRGTGVGRRLMVSLLEGMRGRGFAVSSLYPATTSFYRGLGWGAGGTWHRVVTPSRSLAALEPPWDVSLRPGTFDDLDEMRACYAAAVRHRAGWLGRSGPYWAYRRWEFTRDEGPQRHLYLAQRAGETVGYVAYRHIEDDPRFYGLQIDDLVAADRDVEVALLRLLGSNRSVTDHVAWRGADLDALVLLLAEPDVEVESRWHWMTRFVDVDAAIAARGYLPDVTVEVPLEVTDEHAAWNGGARRLVVRDGEGVLEPGGDGRVRLDVDALASLYTGWASPWELARLGLVAGATEEDLAGLAGAFAGPRPWLPDFF